jgi:hypothetical protein
VVGCRELKFKDGSRTRSHTLSTCRWIVRPKGSLTVRFPRISPSKPCITITNQVSGDSPSKLCKLRISIGMPFDTAVPPTSR